MAVEATGTATPQGTPSAPPTNAGVDPSKTSGARAVTAPFQITSLQNRDRWFKGLFYSAHGVGKTQLGASAVDVEWMNDVLFISAESGEETLYDNPYIENLDRLHTIKVTNFKQVAHIQEFLRAYCSARDRNDVPTMRKLWLQVTGLEAEEPPRFKTVIIDSLTEVEVYCVYQLLNIDIASGKVGEDIDTAGWPEFRKNNEMVKLLVRAYRDLPMHVIFLCAQNFTQDEQKRYHYAPALTGKLASQVQGFVDMVGWITTGAAGEDGVAPRRMFVQPVSGGPKFDAKNRKAVYKGAWFDNPSMKSIMLAIGMTK